MKEMQFSIQIHATKETVWDTLWQDETFREWAGIIDPGMYMAGILKEGNAVHYISAENGYGVTSFVEKLIENELLLLRHQADTKDSGKERRDDEWTGGKESYSLAEEDSMTTLTMACDVPRELEAYFAVTYPKALQRVKELAEK